MKRIHALITLLLLISGCSELRMNETYYGQFMDTDWEFEFKPNGKFVRSFYGHYGQTIYEGRYVKRENLIKIKSGYKNTSETVRKRYIIQDSCIYEMENKEHYYCNEKPKAWKGIMFLPVEE